MIVMAVSRETTSFDDLDPFGRDRFVPGQLVWLVGSFYGGEQKAIVTGRGEWDRWLQAWYWPVRVTSRHTIYGGYRCGECTTVSLPSIRNRRK